MPVKKIVGEGPHWGPLSRIIRDREDIRKVFFKRLLNASSVLPEYINSDFLHNFGSQRVRVRRLRRRANHCEFLRRELAKEARCHLTPSRIAGRTRGALSIDGNSTHSAWRPCLAKLYVDSFHSAVLGGIVQCFR
jgi:hypothetical protein